MSSIVNRLQRTGIKIVEGLYALPDVDDEAAAIIRRVEPYTMTSHERIFGLIQAVRYVTAASVPGCIVECGVWRGGSMMATALSLLGMQNPPPRALSVRYICGHVTTDNLGPKLAW